jgi:hypothetical protein
MSIFFRYLFYKCLVKSIIFNYFKTFICLCANTQKFYFKIVWNCKGGGAYICSRYLVFFGIYVFIKHSIL